MKSVVSDTRVPIKLWEEADKVEPQAMQQLRNVANLPGVFHHVAVMPDVHYGKGATVGSVIATHHSISPAAVGVDIGCGMMAVQTGLHESDLDGGLSILRMAIEKAIPVGFKERREGVEWPGLKEFSALHDKVQDLGKKTARQLGTLGGGNHFIEVCLDEQDDVWVMLHSGSRHIGKMLADVHINVAKGLMKRYLIDLPDPDLAYLVEGTPEFKAYLRDLEWAQAYALANRSIMMEAVLDCFVKLITRYHPIIKGVEVNCHHNYVSREHHFGQNVLVTRKGAVRARQDEYGIIPGSMGTKSYIVKGKGNPESFHSCSHGAGRRMSRGEAKRKFSVADLAIQTDGVECRKDVDVLDEIPGAYKDIDTVMKNQEDLVEVVAVLKQVLCVKG